MSQTLPVFISRPRPIGFYGILENAGEAVCAILSGASIDPLNKLPERRPPREMWGASMAHLVSASKIAATAQGPNSGPKAAKGAKPAGEKPKTLAASIKAMMGMAKRILGGNDEDGGWFSDDDGYWPTPLPVFPVGKAGTGYAGNPCLGPDKPKP